MRSLRVGTVNYSCQSGLGLLTKAFWDHGIVNQMFIVEHSRHPTEWQWYPQTTPHCSARNIDERSLRRFVEGLDVLLCFETPFCWPIVNYAKSRGVKTVCMPMYECSLQNPPAVFDEYWCPSLRDFDVFSDIKWGGDPYPPFVPVSGSYEHSVVRFTPVPVEVEWRQRTEARVFVHNAGHGGLKGRNGTRELFEALMHVESPVEMIIRSQGRLGEFDAEMQRLTQRTMVGGACVALNYNTCSADQLYSKGDVFVFPEKFNGLSLPLQEARAAGMLVMATDRYPMNTWLPTSVEYQDREESFVPLTANPLIPTVTAVKNRIGPPYMEFDEAVIDPRAIAAKIDEWYGYDISAYSLQGKEWAESMSWEKLGPKYSDLLKGLK